MGEYLQETLSDGQDQPAIPKSAPALGELVVSAAELLIISISGCAPKKEQKE